MFMFYCLFMHFHHAQNHPDMHSFVLTKSEPGISHGGPNSPHFYVFLYFFFVMLSPGVQVSRPPAAKGSQKTHFLGIKSLKVFKKYTFSIF